MTFSALRLSLSFPRCELLETACGSASVFDISINLIDKKHAKGGLLVSDPHFAHIYVYFYSTEGTCEPNAFSSSLP